MNYGSLFSGIGGFDLAFDRIGMKCAWQVEIDPTCCAVLERHWPGTLRFKDVRKCGKRNLPKVDVICGGFPCQDLSVAGKGAGLGGSRSGLFWEMVRIVNELRPSFLIFENVPGLFSSFTARTKLPQDAVEGSEWDLDEDSDFETVLAALANIRFHGGWRVLDAKWFQVPQRRRRIFGLFTGRRSGIDCCAKILSEFGRVRGDIEASEEAQQDIAGTIGGGTPGRGWCDDTDRMTFVPHNYSTAEYAESEVSSPTMTQTDMMPAVLTALGFVRRLTPRECERLMGLPDDFTRWRADGTEIADGPRYRMIGNGVVRQVVEWIGKHLVEWEKSS